MPTYAQPQTCLLYTSAYLKILDEDIRRYVFSLDESDNNDPVILDINSVKAVSYTHLDVYKRQGIQDSLLYLIIRQVDLRNI